MRLRRRFASYRRLPPDERRVVNAALILLTITRPALWVHSVPSWRSRLSRLASLLHIRPGGRDAAERTSVRTAQLMLTAARYVVPRPSCLHRSLVLESLLHAQGIPVEIRYGVRRDDGKFEAHSWVEYQGRPITEPGDPDQAYVPMRVSG